MLTSLAVLSCAGAALASQGFLRLDLEHQHGPRLRKRQTPTSDLGQQVVLGENGSLYFLNISIGTPPQPFRLQLDTGSSDVVVTDSRVAACSEADGCPSGSLNPSDSSTYQVVSQGNFNNSYADGTAYIGDYFTDVVSVGGIDISEGNLIMGLATELVDGPELHNDGTGLIGVGYQALSGAIILTYQNETDPLPPTVVSAMVTSGDIGRQAYSLFLGSETEGSGSIIFGGVQPNLYTGDLIAVPVQQEPNPFTNYTEFKVALTGVSVTDLDGTRLLTDSDFAIPVLLDSGNTFTNIPSSILDPINQGFGVTQIGGNSWLPCTRSKANVSITFHFGGEGGPAVNVPLSAMMRPQRTDPSLQAQFDDGENACQLKVEAPIGDTVVLGDSFMRSGYFVFDLENNQIAIAQAAESSASGDISAIPTGTEIPGCSVTNTYTLDAAQLTKAPEEGPAGGEADGQGQITGSVLPGTATFDIGSVSTETANVAASATGGGGASASGSSGGGSGGSDNSAGGLRVAGATLGLVVAAMGAAFLLE